MADSVTNNQLIREAYAEVRFTASRLGHTLKPFRAPSPPAAYWQTYRITNCRTCGSDAHVDLTKQGAERVGGFAIERFCA